MFQCNGKHGPRIPHHPTYFNIEYTNQLSHCIALKQKKERQKHTWAAAAYSKTLSRPPYFDGCLVAFSYYSSWYHFALVTTTKTSCPVRTHCWLPGPKAARAAERTSTDRPTDGQTDWTDYGSFAFNLQFNFYLALCTLGAALSSMASMASRVQCTVQVVAIEARAEGHRAVINYLYIEFLICISFFTFCFSIYWYLHDGTFKQYEFCIIVGQTTLSLRPFIYFKITWAIAILLEHMHKKFEINRTTIKDGCQSESCNPQF